MITNWNEVPIRDFLAGDLAIGNDRLGDMILIELESSAPAASACPLFGEYVFDESEYYEYSNVSDNTDGILGFQEIGYEYSEPEPVPGCAGAKGGFWASGAPATMEVRNSGTVAITLYTDAIDADSFETRSFETRSTVSGLVIQPGDEIEVPIESDYNWMRVHCVDPDTRGEISVRELQGSQPVENFY